jgi:hypothetical protein
LNQMRADSIVFLKPGVFRLAFWLLYQSYL